MSLTLLIVLGLLWLGMVLPFQWSIRFSVWLEELGNRMAKPIVRARIRLRKRRYARYVADFEANIRNLAGPVFRYGREVTLTPSNYRDWEAWVFGTNLDEGDETE